MTHSLGLIDYWDMSLTVHILASGLASAVEEVLCLIEILAVARSEIEFYESHFGNLMTWNAIHLILAKTHFATYAVGIADGDVEEVALACCLIVSHCTLEHMTEVVELMARFLYLLPALGAYP